MGVLSVVLREIRELNKSLLVCFYLILTDELLVRDMGRQIRVQEGTESEAVAPTAAEVGHIDILQGETEKERK